MAGAPLARALALARTKLEALRGRLEGSLTPLRVRATATAGGAKEILARAAQRTAETAAFVQENWQAGGVSALRESVREGARQRLHLYRERLRDSALWSWRPRPWARYKEFLEEQPMACNSLTAAMLYGTGDCIAQELEKHLGIESEGKDRHNVARTLRMVVFGLFLAGPTYCLWYPQLQKMTMAYRDSYEPIRLGFLRLPFFRREALQEPNERAVEVAVKVMVDNLFFQPPFLTLYFLVMGSLEGLSFSKVCDKTRQNFHDAWGLAVMVWVPVQSLNFWFMPVYLQAPFTQLMNMGWKVGLSLFYHSRDHGSSAAAEPAAWAQAPHLDGAGRGAEDPPAAGEERLEREVALLWARVEALREHQAEEADAVAALRRQLREQLAALRRQTQALTALAEEAERQREDLREPLKGLQRQLEEQTRCLGAQAAELARLRDVLTVAAEDAGRSDGEATRPVDDDAS